MSKIVSAFLVLMLFANVLPGAASAADSSSKAGYITASDSLNVRSSASTNSTVVGYLKNGSYVTLLSKSGDWWRVQYGVNQYGYCSSGYINEISGSYAAYSKSSLNVRSGPGTSYEVINWLSNGQYVVVLSSSGGWSKILFNGAMVGYANATYLSTEAPQSTETPQSPEPPQSTEYSSVYLNVPSYKQTDSRWAYMEVGTSGSTIKSIGCVTTALSMTESYRLGTTIYPSEMVTRLKYTASGNVYWPSNYYAYTGSDYVYKVYDLLKSGKPVLIGLTNNYGGQHWVVITGFTGGSALLWSSFKVNDPASNYSYTLQDVVNRYPYFYKLMCY